MKKKSRDKYGKIGATAINLSNVLEPRFAGSDCMREHMRMKLGKSHLHKSLTLPIGRKKDRRLPLAFPTEGL